MYNIKELTSLLLVLQQSKRLISIYSIIALASQVFRTPLYIILLYFNCVLKQLSIFTLAQTDNRQFFQSTKQVDCLWTWMVFT